MGYYAGDVFNYVVQSLVFRLNLLRNETDVRLRLEGAFKCDMRGRTPHEFYEMPVFACRITVAFNISNQFRIRFRGRIETERCFNLVVLQVAIDSLRTANNLYSVLLRCIIFGKHAGIRIRVVAPNDDNCIYIELANNLQSFLELLNLFELCSARANHVEASGVTILLYEIGCDFNIVVVNQSARPHEESVQSIVWIEFFQLIEQTRNHIMSSRCLSTGENHTHIDGFRFRFVSRNEFHERHSVSIREKFLNIILIVYTLCRLSFFNLYCTLECFRQFGLIACSLLLQCTNFHK